MAEVHADRASRGKEVLGVGDVARSLTRIAYEIVERNGGSNNLVIAGIPTRGATLARRLVNRIKEVSGTYAELAIIDTTMYRDDLASQPLRAPKETLVPRTGINGKTVVLVDDVLYTGRTIKAALDALTRIGRPAAVQLASSLIGDTASSPFVRITSARTCRLPATRPSLSCSTKQMGATASFSGKACKR